ncbi:MAG: hypothetical protein R3195_14260 [Gemmatimonadota bacterium]|nr:hypothetical protein [Gemmatimonadota bacterium]
MSSSKLALALPGFSLAGVVGLDAQRRIPRHEAARAGRRARARRQIELRDRREDVRGSVENLRDAREVTARPAGRAGR